MNKCHLRASSGCRPFIVGALLLCLLPLRADGQGAGTSQPAAEGLNKSAVFWTWRGNAAVQECGQCHYQPGNEFSARESELSRFNELQVWLEKDKHAIARQRVEPIPRQRQAAWLERFRERLATDTQDQISVPEYWLGPSNELSAKICEQLEQDVKTEAGYKWFRESCLTCHAGYDPQVGFDSGDRDYETEFEARAVNHPGISCKYCHQETGGSDEWIDLHSGLRTKQKWRASSPAQKAAAGMRDLTPARQQAQLCFDCHVGNLDKGMFVTHDMYAAGHPPLPAVELKTLLDAMPRHWQTPTELASRAAANSTDLRAFFAANFGLDKTAQELQSTPWSAQEIATGAIVAQQHWLKLLIQADKHDRWGDYALYDCTACHHELLVESQRQTLRSAGRPGRPRLLEWPQPGGLAVAATLNDQRHRALMGDLQSAVKKRAFGDRVAVVQASKSLVEHLDQTHEKLALSKLPANFHTQLLLKVCETSPESLLDFQTARWIKWSASGLVDPSMQNKTTGSSVHRLVESMGWAKAMRWS